MNYEIKELARRAVACPRFRWLPGMAGTDALGVPFRCALTHHSGGMMVVAGMAFMPAYPDALARMFPDLTDPATLGCLLALVREVWDDPTASTATTRETDGTRGWIMDCWEPKSPLNWIGPFQSEAEALINALEVAP